jgi:exonuclease VII large subunit
MAEVNHYIKTINSQLLSTLNDNNFRGEKKCRFIRTHVISRQTSFVHKLIAKFTNQFVLLKQEVINSERGRVSYQIRLLKGVNHWIDQQKFNLENLSRLLSSFDMQKVMARGFSVTFTSQEGKY